MPEPMQSSLRFTSFAICPREAGVGQERLVLHPKMTRPLIEEQ